MEESGEIELNLLDRMVCSIAQLGDRSIATNTTSACDWCAGHTGLSILVHERSGDLTMWLLACEAAEDG